MNKSEVNAYLQSVLMQDNEVSVPTCEYNVDESSMQLNSRSTVTSTEKGETIVIIACCNAETLFYHLHVS